MLPTCALEQVQTIHLHKNTLLQLSQRPDTVLPFGLRSAPKIFNAIADALEWIAKSCGVTYLEHFLDDYVTVGAPGTSECDQNLTLLIKTCHTLNLPLANHKKEGPTTCLTFLGIEPDTMRLELRLSTQKLARLKVLLQQLQQRQKASKTP